MLKLLSSDHPGERRVSDGGRSAPPAKPAAKAPSFRALIADDSVTNRFVVDAAVRRCGLETVQAGDGTEAMRAFDEQEDLRLILLDWMMPNWSGLDVCRYIRRHERGGTAYIILITSRSQKEDLRAGLANGADEFLTKPVDPAELELRIKAGIRLLTLQRHLEQNVAQLEAALAEVKQLRTLIPMCMYCKSVRDDEGYWEAVDAYLYKHHKELTVSHGICPTCYEALMKEVQSGEVG